MRKQILLSVILMIAVLAFVFSKQHQPVAAQQRGGLTPEQIEAPESWSAAPRQFLDAFGFTAHFLNVFALLAILCSALRGGNRN